MVIYLPCRLGETFQIQKFVNWENGCRVYKPGEYATLAGFHAIDLQTRSLSIPTIITENPKRLISFDPEGEFSQEFVPKYAISLDVKTELPLCDFGFPGKRRARLCGITMRDGVLHADFSTSDRCEHLIYPIKDTIQYIPIEKMNMGMIPETKLEYKRPYTRKDAE